MTQHTLKNPTSGEATWSFYGDNDTGVDSSAANQIELMAGGTTVLTATSTGFVAGGLVDLNGVADALVLDADGDTTLSAPTANQIDVEIAGADDFTFTANTFTALSGSAVATNTINETTAGSGVTIDSVLLKDGTVDLNGVADALILDADGNSSISAPTDNQIDVEINGADDFTFTANTFTALSGSTIKTNNLDETTAGSGITLDGDLLAASGSSDFRHRKRARLFEDFMDDAGATLPTLWGTQDTSAAGTPTLNYVADSINGTYNIAHDGTSEAQTMTLYWADQLMIDPAKKPVFECRLKIDFAGANFSADQRIVIGLASARNATLDSIASNVWFRIEGANLNILVEADDGTTDTDDQDSTIDLVDNTYTTFRIDMSNLSAIGFYVDGVAQGGAAVAAALLTASNPLQPYIEIQRDAGTEAESVSIDYIMVEWDRV